MTWTGRLEWLDLGPGQAVLRTADGKSLPLYGDVPKALLGQQVEISGRQVEAFGVAMNGEPAGIEVDTVRRT